MNESETLEVKKDHTGGHTDIRETPKARNRHNLSREEKKKKKGGAKEKKGGERYKKKKVSNCNWRTDSSTLRRGLCSDAGLPKRSVAMRQKGNGGSGATGTEQGEKTRKVSKGSLSALI